MKMPPFKLYSPTSIDEAIKIARNIQSKEEDFDWISGGTDLIPNYKWHLNPKKECDFFSEYFAIKGTH